MEHGKEDIMKKLVLMLIAMALLIQAPGVLAKEQPLKIYVSLEAEANGDGSLEHPYKTLVEARDAVRQIKKNGAYRRLSAGDRQRDPLKNQVSR